MTRFDVDGLFVTVVYRHYFSALCYAFGCGFAGVFRGFFLAGGEIGEGTLEGGGHGVAFEEGDAADEVFPCFCFGGSISFCLYRVGYLTIECYGVKGDGPASSGSCCRSTRTEKS